MKKIAIYLLTITFIGACSEPDRKNYVIIENKTNDYITVDFYNVWTGVNDTTLSLKKQKYQVPIDEDILVGIYAGGIGEISLLTHKDAYVVLTDSSIVTDSINDIVQKHIQWSNEIATGESIKPFTWSKNIRHEYISDWQEFDKYLFFAFNPKNKQQHNTEKFKNTSIHAYPAAYMLLNKMLDTSDLWVKQHVEFICNKLETIKLYTPTKEAFLTRYFQPESSNLRNDSAIITLSHIHESIGNQLNNKLKNLKSTAVLKQGQNFPPLTAQSTCGREEPIEFKTPYTIIDFWATWCIPCIKQMPDMEKLATHTKGTVSFVSISVDNQKDLEKWKKFTETPSNIRHYWLPNATKIREQLGIKSLPRMILLDKDGKVVDPDFPHLNNTLATKWISKLSSKNTPANKSE